MKQRCIRVISLVLCAVLLMPSTALPAAASGSGSSFGDGLIWELDASGRLTISGDGEIPDYSDPSEAPWYNNRLDVTELVIEEGITRIGDFSLLGMDNVTSVELPQSLLSIGTQSMAYLWSLTTLHIPSNVTTLGPACFGGCVELSSLYIYNPDTTFEFLPYGYRYDSSVDDYVPIYDVTLYGIANSTAQIYANAHSNIKFVPITSGTISGSVVKTEEMARTDTRDLIHIYTEEDLKKIADNPGGHYLLENDLTLSDWTPIDLSGSFNGQGHTISGLSVTQSVSGRYGLFGIMSGTVVNLNVSGQINVMQASEWTGAGLLAGECTGTVVNCSAEGTVTVVGGNTSYAGGLTGHGGTFENCQAEVAVSLTISELASWAYAGGLSASYVTKANNCSYTGDVILVQQVSAPGLKAEVRGIASNNKDACTNCTVSGTLTMNVLDCYNSGAIALEGAAASQNYATVTATSQGDIYAHGCADSTNCINHADISVVGTGEEGVVDAAGLMRVEGGHNYGTITAEALGTEEAIAQGISAATGSGLSNTGSVSSTANNGQAVAFGIEGNASDCQNTAAITAVGFEAAALGLTGCDYSQNTANIRATSVSEEEGSHSFAVGVSGAEESINSGNVSASGAILNQAFGCRSCRNSCNSGTITVRTSEDGYAYGLYYCEESYNSGGVSAIGSGCSGNSIVFAFGHTGGNCASSAYVSASSDGRTTNSNGTYYGQVRGGNSASVRVARPGYPVITQSGPMETSYMDGHGEFAVVTEGTTAVDWTATEPPEPENAPTANVLSAAFCFAQSEDTFIPAMTNALGSFIFDNGHDADINDPTSTDYSTIYLMLALGNLYQETSAADTLTVELPDGFSFSPECVETRTTLDITPIDATKEEIVWLTVYPLYSTSYSEGSVLTCRYTLGSEGNSRELSTGCKINLTTERADYAKINYGYNDKSKAYQFAYYQWDPSVLEKDNTLFHKELNQLSALLSMVIYFTNTNNDDAITAMEGLGFSCIDLSGENSVTDSRHIVAQKIIVTADDQVQQLVVTAVLGTSSTEGWIGNFTFLESAANHTTFLSSAQSAYSSLRQFLSTYGIDNVEQKMLLTGHSRGAATANLLADMVNQQYASNWENIYAYTYATPHTSQPEVVEAAAQRNRNIFNICNFYDLVAYVPGCYDLHGTTLYYKVTDDLFAPQYITYLRTLTFEKAVNSSEAKGALSLALANALLQTKRIEFYHLMKYYIEDIWLSTADTYMTYSAAITSMEQQYNQGLAMAFGTKVENSILGKVLTAYLRKHIVNTSVLQGLVETQGYTPKDVPVGDIGIDVAYPADFSSFMQNPANDTYVQINCPVDLDIYDESGTLIGQVKDDQVVSGSDKLILTVVGDKKSLNLLSDQTYIIKITGYKSGTMDLSMVTNNETGVTTGIQQYSDLPVSKTSTLTAKVENGVLILLDETQQQIEPELIQGSDLRSASISISEHDSVAFTAGEGTYNVGEQVILMAIPAEDDTVFKGWYNGDVLVSADATTCFVCTESMTLTPVYGAPDETPPADDDSSDEEDPSDKEDPDGGEDTPVGNPDATGFYHTYGDKILDPDGNEVVLKGISLGNVNYGNPSDISFGPVYSQDEASYAELAAMGIDHVRFEINYGLFEDDANPYQYKESGFAWLDQNIEWAKKHGINLIIQMKHAQGGYQESTDRMVSTEWLGDGGKLLWMDIDQETGEPTGGTEYLENQKRLIALWTAIAERYADETAIIGYGLLNEPVVPQLSTADETLAQWKDLAQEIADAIRTVDTNHILFVEQLLTFFKPNDYYGTDWNQVSLENKQFLINDQNTVYEFHFYEPFEFTSQGATGLDQYDGTANTYPSNTVISGTVDWNSSTLNIDKGTQMETSGEWSRYEASFTTQNGQFVYANPQILVPNLNSNTIYVDDVIVTRTDSSGKETTLYHYTFEEDDYSWWGYWDSDNSAIVEKDQTTACVGNGSLRISGMNSQWANARSGDWFYMEPNCTYNISVWMKNVNTSSSYTPRFELRAVSNVMTIGKEYVSYMLDRYLSFGETNNVPMFVGEWGVHNNCMSLGADNYIKDVTDLFEEYGVSSNYHGYHDPDFGLYCEQEYLPRGERNETLYESLVAHYGSQANEVDNLLFSIVLINDNSEFAVGFSCGQTSATIAIAGYEESGRFAGVQFIDVTKYDAYIEQNVEIENASYFRAFLLTEEGYVPIADSVRTN